LRQRGDYPARLVRVVDQLDLDIEQLEQRLGLVGAGLGQMGLDLRAETLEEFPGVTPAPSRRSPLLACGCAPGGSAC
jgi:hypothetical protein